MIEFNLNLIEGGNDVEVQASAGPNGTLGQAWQLLGSEDLARLERIRQQAESAGWSASPDYATRDLPGASVRCQTREDVDRNIEEIGRELFNILVRNEIREVYERARTATLEGREDALLVLVKLRTRSSLQGIPWELLHDGYCFLAKDRRSAVVRYLEQTPPVANLEVKPPLRVLVTSASPKDLSPIAVEKEEDAVRLAYEEAGPLVEVVPRRNVSLDDLERLWRRAGNQGKPFHIWHHCGHGTRRTHADRDEFMLSLETGGRNQPVDLETLQEIVGFCPDLRIAVFNVCHGGSSAGIVPALVRLNVPVVIGFEQAVRDPAAVRFATVLHESLLHVPVEFAVSQARSSLSVQKTSFDWIHALAFSRRRDRGTVLPKPAKKERAPVMKRTAKETRKSNGGISIEIGTLGGTDNEVIGSSYVGGNHRGPGKTPVQIKAKEITGSGARLVGFQSITGFSDSEVAAREARVEKLLRKLEGQAATGMQP